MTRMNAAACRLRAATPGSTPEVALRLLAIAIAIAGLVDPVMTMARRQKPTVAVLSVAAGSTAAASDRLADRVAADLSRAFTVVRGPLPGVEATVLVASELPPNAFHAGPAFVVMPTPTKPRITIEGIEAPRRASFDGRMLVTVHLHAEGAARRTDRIALSTGGLVVDRVVHRWTSDDDRAEVTLGVIPTGTGIVRLRVGVEPGGGVAADIAPAASAADIAPAASAADIAPAASAADIAIDVEPHRWSVLVHDARPSWASTFVRRALEDDRRFVLSALTTTSRGLAVETGQPAPSLSDPARLESVDVVVVGAPDALTAADVDGLEAFARRRGGSVVLLMDRPDLGPFARLTGVERWGARSSATSFAIRAPSASASAGRMAAAELALPETLPSEAETVASATVGKDTRPVMWRLPLGAGQVIVSGALDAWRFRAAKDTTFSRFWQALIGAAADAAPAPMDLRVSDNLLAPGDPIDVELTIRESLSGAPENAMAVSATLEHDGITAPVRLWPDATRGRFRAYLHAPAAPGLYRLVATNVGGNGASRPLGATPGAIPASTGEVGHAAASRVEVPLIVGDHVSRPTGGDQAALLGAWAHANRGDVLPASRVSELSAKLDAVIHPDVRPERVRPMRSPWWIGPFALVLGAEWWLRRRRGEA